MEDLTVIDYFGPLIAFLSFITIIFTLSFTVIFWVCIRHEEQHEVLNKWHGFIRIKRQKVAPAELKVERQCSENGKQPDKGMNGESNKAET